MDLKELDLIGPDQERHWYYASKSHALRRALGDYQPRQILDVGAGSGFFARVLLRDTAAQSAVCVDPGYADERSELYFDKRLVFSRTIPVAEADLVLLMDVLEHVDDDVGLLRDVGSRTGPEARFIVSVPAFSWLWSGHDEFLGHRRRYTHEGLRRVLAAAGLRPLAGFYMFAAIFPAVAAQRLWQRVRRSAGPPTSDLRRHRGWSNALLTRLCIAESAIARHNRAFGLTAFAVAEKT
jgi:SAM-dependent methyltransferase